MCVHAHVNDYRAASLSLIIKGTDAMAGKTKSFGNQSEDHPLAPFYATGMRLTWLRAKIFWVPQWSEFGKITESKTISSLFVFTGLIPIIIQLTSLGQKYCIKLHVGNLCIPFELPFSWWLLYFSGAAAILAKVIYMFRCPDWVKRYDRTLNIDPINISQRELHKQAQRYFEIEYNLHSIPRYLLYCGLFKYNRNITDVQKDFDELYNEFFEAAKSQSTTNFIDGETPITAAHNLLNFNFVVHFLESITSHGSVRYDTRELHSLIEQSPGDFFLHHYDLQNSSRRCSRRICALLVMIAYLCLSIIFVQNMWVVLAATWN